MADSDREAVEGRPQTHERLLSPHQRYSNLTEGRRDPPIHENTTSPDLLSQTGIICPRLRRSGLHIESETLSHPDRQSNNHPCTMGIISTLQIAAYKQQALDNIQISRLVGDTLWSQKSPSTSKVILTCALPELRLERFLQLRRQSENSINCAQRNSLVFHKGVAGEQAVICPKESFLVDKRFQRANVPPINVNHVVCMLSQR